MSEQLDNIAAAQGQAQTNKANTSRQRLVYIRIRLAELKEERERLISERDWLKAQSANPVDGV